MLTPNLSMAFKYIQKLKRPPFLIIPFVFLAGYQSPHTYTTHASFVSNRRNHAVVILYLAVCFFFYGDVEWQAVCSPLFFPIRHDQMVESERLVLNRESITLIVKQVAIFNFYRGIPASRLISGFGTLSLATITLESKMALHDSKCLISMIIQKNLKL